MEQIGKRGIPLQTRSSFCRPPGTAAGNGDRIPSGRARRAILFDPDRPIHLFLHGGFKKNDSGFPRALCVVHGHVRKMKKIVSHGRVRGAKRDPHAQLNIGIDVLAQFYLVKMLGQRGQIMKQILFRDIPCHEQRELASPDARKRVFSMDVFQKAASDAFQYVM